MFTSKKQRTRQDIEHALKKAKEIMDSRPNLCRSMGTLGVSVVIDILAGLILDDTDTEDENQLVLKASDMEPEALKEMCGQFCRLYGSTGTLVIKT